MSTWQRKLTVQLTLVQNKLVALWRKLNPGLRYALIYFLAVITIASAMWRYMPGSRAFNPGSFVQSPTGEENGKTDVGTEDEPDETGEKSEQSGAGFEQMGPPDNGQLQWPLAGEVIVKYGEPFWLAPGWVRAGIDGIHIAGTKGAIVVAAWQGTVIEAVSPSPMERRPGAVTLDHGSWQTVYINVSPSVQVGQRVSAGQKIGVLAPKLEGLSEKDFLEFQVIEDQEHRDPLALLQSLH